MDYSRRSIDHARQYALDNDLNFAYRFQYYLELDDEALYEAGLLIYGDFCPLNPEQRATLLRNVHRALKPNGKFLLDVYTCEHLRKNGNKNGWYALDSGFWKPSLHLALEEGFDYPGQSIWLDQTITIEANAKASIYRNWFQDYTPESITAKLSQGGPSRVCGSDLTGQPYTTDSEWIGIIARKS